MFLYAIVSFPHIQLSIRRVNKTKQDVAVNAMFQDLDSDRGGGAGCIVSHTILQNS